MEYASFSKNTSSWDERKCRKVLYNAISSLIAKNSDNENRRERIGIGG